MLNYILRRILIMIPTLFLISVVVFSLAKFMPGDALTGKIDPHNTNPQYIAEQRKILGLDDPVYKQYFRWAKKIVLHGDFGESFTYKVPVTKIIDQALPNTMFLAALAMILTYTIAILSGRYSGKNPYRLGDYSLSGINYFLLGVPSFVSSLIGIYFFAFTLHWIPADGYVGSEVQNGTLAYYLSRLYHTILPALILGSIATASHTQFLRNDIIENSRKDYVRTARAKGTRESTIYNKHIFRNSIIPMVTLFGFDIGSLLGGAVIVETIFTYPGMGQLFVNSVQVRDYSVVIGIVLLLSILTLVGNLIADILYSIVDPRVRIE